jgi:hypothetical protein
MQNPPFTRSYWVIPGRFLAGSYPGGQTAASAATKTKGLIDAGVTDIVSLMESDETNHAGFALRITCRPPTPTPSVERFNGTGTQL